MLDEELSGEDMQTLLAADVNTIQKLLTHQHQDWVGNVIKVRIHRLMVFWFGTNMYPHANLKLDLAKTTVFSANISKNKVQPQVENKLSSHVVFSQYGLFAVHCDFDDHMKCVEVRNVFLENEYVLL